ncbi:MAG TPA: hypothetical protein VD713_06010, partial [Sphingomonadales bacterium]|nr:hypothetical protein [Sphingomonadales bacterium]
VERETPLRLAHSSRLPALDAAGLRERVDASFQGAAAAVISAGLRLFLPLQRTFPPDILLLFFRTRT